MAQIVTSHRRDAPLPRSLLACWLGCRRLAFSGRAGAQVAPSAVTPLPSFTALAPNPY